MDNQLPVVSDRFSLQAQQIAKHLPDALQRRGLAPAFSGYYLTTVRGLTMLIAALDVSRLGDQKPYTTAQLRHELSTELGGRKVYLSNSSGIRYVVLLSHLPKLSRRIALPTLERGTVGLGQNFAAEKVEVEWQKLGHVLVTGITGSGKSQFLRLLALQALRDDMQLGIADIDQATFPMLADHPNLLTKIAGTPTDALQVIQRALGECDQRARLFQTVGGFPENLDEFNAAAIKEGKPTLKRILLILDEFSSTMLAMGGGKGEMGQLLAALGMRGRKFGVTVVFAAHEFTKEQVGLLRSQCGTVVCFHTDSKELATKLGCGGAHRIPLDRPGLAITNRWGPMQSYLVDKAQLTGDGQTSEKDALAPIEREVFERAIHKGGRVTLSLIQSVTGGSANQASRLQRAWAMRGLVRKSAANDNAFVLTERVWTIFGEKPKTAETEDVAENRQKPIYQPDMEGAMA